jgi:hypothetical protein
MPIGRTPERDPIEQKENSEQICVLQAGQHDTLGNMKFQSSDIEALEILFISSIPPSHIELSGEVSSRPDPNRSFEPHSPFFHPFFFFFSLLEL